jgi:hypothetical protein
MTAPQAHSKSFPVFGCLCGALALIAAVWWEQTTASTFCQVLANQTQQCATAAYQHNIAAVAGLALAVLAAVCFTKRW